MAKPIVRVDLSNDDDGFQHRVLEPGVPLLDASGDNARIAFQLIGRYAGHPQWDGSSVKFFLQDDDGRRCEGVDCQPVAAENLEGPLAEELKGLQFKLSRARPTTHNATLVQQALRQRLKDQSVVAEENDPGCFFFEYADGNGKGRREPKLVWCWGYQRVGDAEATARICSDAQCSLLYLQPVGYRRKCPSCFPGAPLTKPRRFSYKWLAAPVLLLLLLALGVYWLMSPRAVLTGTVVDAGDRSPLAGAEIRIAGTEHTAVTDQQGAFRIERLHGGPISIEAAADGYPPMKLDQQLRGSGETDVQIALAGDVIVTGTVTSAISGNPIEGALVRISTTTQQIETGADGRFRVDNVRRGPARFEIAAAGFVDEQLERDLSPGGSNELNVLLVSGTVLRGRVTDAADGSPVAGAKINIQDSLLTTASDEQGKFTLPADSGGTVMVLVTADGFNSEQIETELKLGKPTDVDVALDGDAVVVGTVTNSKTRQPVADAEVRIAGSSLTAKTDQQGRYRITGARSRGVVIEVAAVGFGPATVKKNLASGTETTVDVALGGDGGLVGMVVDATDGTPIAGARISLAGASTSEISDSQGRFQLGDVRSGTIELTVTAAGYPQKTVTQQVGSGGPTNFEIKLQGNAVIVGTVTNSQTKKPVAGAHVVLDGGSDRTTETDDQGRFRFEQLRGGSAELKVTAKGYSDRTVKETIQADDENTIDVVLGGDAAVEGQLINKVTREPIAGAKVSFVDTPFSTTTDRNGRFRIDGLFGGRSTLRIDAAGFKEVVGPKTLAAGQTTSIGVFELTGPGAIGGRVVSTADGTPVSGATVTIAGTKYTTRTRTDGTYRFTGVPSGGTTIQVEAPGYGRQQVAANVLVDKPTAVNDAKLSSNLALTGRVINAMNENPVRGAKVTIAGTNLQATTDFNGSYRITGLPPRPVTVNVAASGFFDDQQTAKPGAGGVNIRSVLSPKLKPGEARIVLTWGALPDDLDAHLWGPLPAGGQFHVFHNTDKATNVKLDVDNRKGHGPETITITKAIRGTYIYRVHAYKDPKAPNVQDFANALAKSGAQVKVYYYGARQPAEFAVGTGASGNTVWNVCQISGDGSGRVTVRGSNSYSNSLPQ